jgi:hypothetical protein
MLRVWLPGQELENFDGKPRSIRVEIPVRAQPGPQALEPRDLPKPAANRPILDATMRAIVLEEDHGSVPSSAPPRVVARNLPATPPDREQPAPANTISRHATRRPTRDSGRDARLVPSLPRNPEAGARARSTPLPARQLGLMRMGQTGRTPRSTPIEPGRPAESAEASGVLKLPARTYSVPTLETHAVEQALEPESGSSIRFTFEEWLPGRPVSHIRMALEPADLGGLRITLKETAGKIHASIVADRSEALPLLAAQMAALKSALALRGVQFSSFSLTAATAAGAVGLTRAGLPAASGPGRRLLPGERDELAQNTESTSEEVIRS